MTPDEIARASADSMWAGDRASQALGMTRGDTIGGSLWRGTMVVSPAGRAPNQRRTAIGSVPVLSMQGVCAVLAGVMALVVVRGGLRSRRSEAAPTPSP